VVDFFGLMPEVLGPTLNKSHALKT